MFFDIVKDIIYGHSFVYVSILVVMFALFLGAILMCLTKGFSITKNAYYSSIFHSDVWNQTIDRSKRNALTIQDKSIVANMFIVGIKTFSDAKKNEDDAGNSSSVILVKSTMRVMIEKEIIYLTQGFNLLSFNAVFMPYAALILALWSVIEIFNSVDIGVLTLTMFIKPLFVIVYGLIMAAISSVVFMIGQNKINEIESISNLFINEFVNNLHKSYYTKENDEK